MKCTWLRTIRQVLQHIQSFSAPVAAYTVGYTNLSVAEGEAPARTPFPDLPDTDRGEAEWMEPARDWRDPPPLAITLPDRAERGEPMLRPPADRASKSCIVDLVECERSAASRCEVGNGIEQWVRVEDGRFET